MPENNCKSQKVVAERMVAMETGWKYEREIYEELKEKVEND